MYNFYLAEDYLGDYDMFTSNISNIIEIHSERDEDSDRFYKDDIYTNQVYQHLTDHYSQENQNIIIFIEKLELNTTNKINNIIDLNARFNIDDDNAFLGVDFTKISKKNHHISVMQDYEIFKMITFKKRLFCANDDTIKSALGYLYSDYTFHNQVIDDIKEIVRHNRESDFERVFDLLNDIKDHPHTGGLGKTETLKKTNGKCSKRFDSGDRIIYSLKGDKITVFSLLGHYENV